MSHFSFVDNNNKALEVGFVSHGMNRVVWVEAEFQECEQEEKTLWGRVKKKRITSNCRIDGQRLARDIQSTVDQLNEQGYEVVAVTPVTSGMFSAWSKGGLGYSFTEGALVTARACGWEVAQEERLEERSPDEGRRYSFQADGNDQMDPVT
jgi:hypothetical protein